MQEFEPSVVRKTASELAEMGGIVVDKFGITSFAHEQNVDKNNPHVSLTADLRSVARAEANQILQLIASERRRNRGRTPMAQNSPVQKSPKEPTSNFGIKAHARRSLSRRTFSTVAPRVKLQPIMSNVPRANVARIGTSPLFQANARPVRPGYEALRKIGGAAVEMGIGFATGGPAGLLIAAASRIQASTPSVGSNVISIAAVKRDMFASPKQKMLNQPDDDEFMEAQPKFLPRKRKGLLELKVA